MPVEKVVPGKTNGLHTITTSQHHKATTLPHHNNTTASHDPITAPHYNDTTAPLHNPPTLPHRNGNTPPQHPPTILPHHNNTTPPQHPPTTIPHHNDTTASQNPPHIAHSTPTLDLNNGSAYFSQTIPDPDAASILSPFINYKHSDGALSNIETATISITALTQAATGNNKNSDASGEPPADQLLSPPSAKDKGYAWVVVMVVFTLNTLTAGYVKSFGILYILVLEYLPHATGVAGGLIIGLLVGCRGLLSPVVGALTVVIGPRKCVIVGALMVTLGLITAVPAFSIYYMAATLGALVGIGMCMAETPGFLLVTDYFLEKLPMANAIRAAGNPMGGMLFPPLVVFLHEQFGLQGTLIMMAGLMLQVVILGSLMRPFKQHKQIIQSRYRKQVEKKHGINAARELDTQYNNLQEKINAPKKKPLDFSFLINPAYIVYIVMLLGTNFPMPNALLYAPVHGNLVGLSAYENSMIASYLSGADFILRLLSGWFANKNIIKKTHIFVGGLLVGGVGCIGLPFCSNTWQIMATSTFIALGMAIFWTLINTLLAEQFGGDAMSSTFGFFRMGQGICNFFYPSLIGLVLDVTGGTLVPYLLMGLGFMFGGLVFALQPLIIRISGAKINPE